MSFTFPTLAPALHTPQPLILLVPPLLLLFVLPPITILSYYLQVSDAIFARLGLAFKLHEEIMTNDMSSEPINIVIHTDTHTQTPPATVPDSTLPTHVIITRHAPDSCNTRRGGSTPLTSIRAPRYPHAFDEENMRARPHTHTCPQSEHQMRFLSAILYLNTVEV